jgi:DNA polymerase-1
MPDTAPILKPITFTPPMNVTLVTDDAGLDKLAAFFEKYRGTPIGWDLETKPTDDFFMRPVRSVQFGNTQEQYVVDLLALCNFDEAFWTQGKYGKSLSSKYNKFLKICGPVMCSREFPKVGVNLWFEYVNMYWNFGLRTQGFFDCWNMEHIIWAGAHSLKDYPFFSMASQTARYFHREVSKELQASFDYESPLTPAQIEYAALDTRIPLKLMEAQLYILRGKPWDTAPVYLKHLPAFLFGDNLLTIARIENCAIGSFAEMHIHGDWIDIPRWTKKIDKRKIDLVSALAELDAAFIPFVGKKQETITVAQLALAEAKWKTIKLSEKERRAERDELKAAFTAMRQKYTTYNKLAKACQGTALINYNSPAQIKEVVHQLPGMSKVKSTDADFLERHLDIPLIKALATYRKIAKEISTYGMSWCQEWQDKPCNEQGWISPHDHKLHPKYNQYEAETGRTSSDSPNGQNLPHDPETRACFIAGPPDDDLPMVSKCCSATIQLNPASTQAYICTKCNQACETKLDDYVLITIDMAGAELRILADVSGDPVWIRAFNENQDVHCICCDMVNPELWASHTGQPGDTYTKKGKEYVLPPDYECAYFKLRADGQPQRFKCDCPKHNEQRGEFKPVNFGIAYGLGPSGLAPQIKKTKEEAKKILKDHRKALPRLWKYIDASGKFAVDQLKSFDLFGRRRLFMAPTYEQAKMYIANNQDEHEETITLQDAFKALQGNIERQGKNHPIQSGNASISKLAMGAGFDKHGKPYLWHIFPKYGARLVKMVHDELVIRVPRSRSLELALLCQDAIRRAAAERMKRVTMESEYHVETYWVKG